MEARRLSRLTVKLFPPSDIARTIELIFKMSESLKAACLTYTAGPTYGFYHHDGTEY